MYINQISFPAWSLCLPATSLQSIGGTLATQVVPSSQPLQGGSQGGPSQLTRPLPQGPQPRARWSVQEVFFVCFSLVAPHQGKKHIKVKYEITFYYIKEITLGSFLHSLCTTVFYEAFHVRRSRRCHWYSHFERQTKLSLKGRRLFWSSFYFIKELGKVFLQTAITLGHQFTGHCISWQHHFSGINRIF